MNVTIHHQIYRFIDVNQRRAGEGRQLVAEFQCSESSRIIIITRLMNQSKSRLEFLQQSSFFRFFIRQKNSNDKMGVDVR